MWLKNFRQFLKKEAYIIPVYLCLFFVPIFYNPFFVASFSQGKELLLRFILIVSAFVLILFSLIRNNFQFQFRQKSSLFLILIIGAAIVVLANVFSPTPVITLYGTLNRGFGLITQAFLICFIIYCGYILDQGRIKKALLCTFASGVFVAIYAIIQNFVDPLFGGYDKALFVGRVFSFLGNPGYLGQFLLLIAILGVYFFWKEENRKCKWIYAVGTVLTLLAMLLSETRASFLALLPCVFLISIKYKCLISSFIKKIKLSRKIIAILLVILFGASVFAIIPKDKFSFSDAALRSLYSRFEIWKGAIHLIEKKPWFGYGEETFSVYAPEIITKDFLTLEQDIHLSIDRVHNEFLEILFSYGVFGAVLYLIFFVAVLVLFFKFNENIGGVLALMIIANMIQNQFTFSDITISVLISFCIGGLIAIQNSSIDEKNHIYSIPLILRYILAGITVLLTLGLLYSTVYIPSMSQLAYAQSQKYYATNYDRAVLEHKKALSYTPYYSTLWYQLMMLDPSSMKKALNFLEKIEGNSGDVLVWYGNYYSKTDPAKASDYFLEALKINPYYPDWIRAFGDVLYKNGDYTNALFLYKNYLDASPPFWQWKDTLMARSPEEQKAYRIFFKNVPDFWNIVTRVDVLNQIVSD